MKQVNKFKYIGSIISKTGKCDTEIRSCIWIAKVAFQNVIKVLSHSKIVRNKEEKVLNCYITSESFSQMKTQLEEILQEVIENPMDGTCK